MAINLYVAATCMCWAGMVHSGAQVYVISKFKMQFGMKPDVRGPHSYNNNILCIMQCIFPSVVQVFWLRPLLEQTLPLEVVVHFAVDHVASGVLKLLLLVSPPPLRGLLTFQLGPHCMGKGKGRDEGRDGRGGKGKVR